MSDQERLSGYTQQIFAADRAQLEAVRKVRIAAFNDETLPSIARAVLASTGSIEQLNKYRAIARDIGKHITEPIIVISKRDPQNRKVVAAQAGYIADVAHGEVEGESEKFTAQIKVPVTSALDFTWSRETGGVAKRLPADTEITIANIRAHTVDQEVLETEQDYQERISLGNPYAAGADPKKEFISTVPDSNVYIGDIGVIRAVSNGNGLDNVLIGLIEQSRNDNA